MRYLPLVLAFALAYGVARTVATRCHDTPERRGWFRAAGIAGLVIAAALVPWLFAKLKPPFSESPSGLFVILGKALIVGGLALSGVGAIIGTFMRRPVDDA